MSTSIESCSAAAAGPILNISTYKFISLDHLEERKSYLKDLADSLELKGTILLSPEGINMFLAGHPDKIQGFFDELHKDPKLADIQPKESLSSDRPFRRMLVRLKKEIIAFGIDQVKPEKRTSPKLAARELKKWLDEGRPVRLLDVRNDYEIQLGTFRNAEHLDLHHFRDFPVAIAKLPAEAKEQPVVMFCTGGIRCEKAGPLMEQAGFKHVYQLNGGILKYFEEVGGAHWDGSCFVFDNRVALAPNLQPTGDQLCYACQSILTPQQLQSPFYKLGEHCPNCYRSPEQLAQQRLQQRQQKIIEIASAQPGCQAYDNYRKLHVPRRMAGASMLEFLRDYQPTIDEERWLEWISRGEITYQDCVVTPEMLVREGQQFIQHQPNTVEPSINPQIELLHEDELLAVINKPAPLPTHPSGRFNRNTLTSILEQAYPQQKLRVAHRLDANTTGVVVLCRKAQASRFVQPQFAANQIQKVYLARVHGVPVWNETTCRAAVGDEPGEGGSRQIVDEGNQFECVTHFRRLGTFADGTSLIEARPLSGKTHQIRLHLWHLGFSIVGDPLYLTDGKLGQNMTLSIGDRPMCLHAHQITLIHPASKQSVTYSAALPVWTQDS